MWFNVIIFANWYGHYLQYSVKKSYRYIKWKLLKGRHVTDLKHEILGLNINISQRTKLFYCNYSVLIHKSNFTSVYIQILREIYCFLSYRMECYNFWHSFKRILYETCKYALNMNMRPNLNKTGLGSCPKVFLSSEIMCFNVITFANWYGHYLQYSVKKSYRYIK